MADDNEELKKKVDKLEREIEDLKKKLEENSKRDKKHHKELKQISQQNHKENLTWNRMGATLTPLAVVIIPFVVKYFDRNRNITSQDIKPIKKDADNISEKMDKILEAMEGKTKQ